MSSITASAPANIFLTGEQAVVYGYPSVLTAVQKRVFACSTFLKERIIYITSDMFGEKRFTFREALENKPPASDPLYPFARICAILSKKSQKDCGVHIRIRSEIPPEAGMSSSSASLCAVARSILTLLDIQDIDWYSSLFPLQVWIHGGKASGSELTSSCHGGTHLFKKIEDCNSKATPYIEKVSSTPFSIVIGDTCVRTPTALPVGIHIPSLMKRKPKFVEVSFNRIGELAHKAIGMIHSGDIHGLGAVLNENQTILRDLMVSHPKLDDAIEEAMQAGALGAKLSGGGWGGVMFALVTPDTAEDVACAIKETGCKVFKTEIGGNGMKIEVDYDW